MRREADKLKRQLERELDRNVEWRDIPTFTRRAENEDPSVSEIKNDERILLGLFTNPVAQVALGASTTFLLVWAVAAGAPVPH